jgi:hypothetical protein
MRRFLTVLTALAAASTAQAANWMLVAVADIASGVTMTTAVDTESIRRREGHLSAWSKLSYTSPQKDLKNGEAYSSEMQLYAYDCDAEKYTLLSATEYSGSDADGAAVGVQYEQQQPLKWFHPSPGSTGGDVLKFVCGVAAKLGR